MDDTIYRQAAIDAMNRHLDTIPVTNNNTMDMIRRSEVMDCRGIINSLPSAETERKKGKWISKGYGEYRCSSCRNIVDLDEEILMSIKMFDYCPVCGADMRGEQDDDNGTD